MTIAHSSWLIGHRNKNRLNILIFFFSIFFLSAISYELRPCYAETISSKELIENAKSLDGKTVAYRGEAVTAILNRGEYSWMNLHDGDNAICVWAAKSDSNIVRFIGDYRHKGDILDVDGTFNRACPLHGGELDIHADSVKIVKPGHLISEKMNRKKIGVSATLFLIILSIIAIFRKRV